MASQLANLGANGQESSKRKFLCITDAAMQDFDRMLFQLKSFVLIMQSQVFFTDLCSKPVTK